VTTLTKEETTQEQGDESSFLGKILKMYWEQEKAGGVIA